MVGGGNELIEFLNEMGEKRALNDIFSDIVRRGPLPILLIVGRSQEINRYMLFSIVVAHPMKDLQAVHMRHVKIEKDDVGRGLRRHAGKMTEGEQPIRAVGDRVLKPRDLENDFRQAGKIAVILGMNNSEGGSFQEFHENMVTTWVGSPMGCLPHKVSN
jgi:hypothetical protein